MNKVVIKKFALGFVTNIYHFFSFLISMSSGIFSKTLGIITKKHENYVVTHYDL